MIPKTIKVFLLNVGDSGKLTLQMQSYFYRKNLSENSPIRFKLVITEKTADWIFICGNYVNITQLNVVKDIFNKSKYTQKFFMVGNLKIDGNEELDLNKIVPFTLIINGNPTPSFENIDKSLNPYFKEKKKISISIQREK